MSDGKTRGLLFTLVMVFALMGAGCGGGSSTMGSIQSGPLMEAKEEAATAHTEAQTALQRVMASKAANPTAYAEAEKKVKAAKAASDRAQAARTLEAARAEQQAAEAASRAARDFVDIVAAAQAAMDAYQAAQAALAAVEADKESDRTAYDAAKKLVDSAKVASDQAQMARTLEAAKLAKEVAQQARINVVHFVAKVAAARDVGQLVTVKQAAMDAYQAAQRAADGVSAYRVLAQSESDQAKAKAAAAKAASDRAQAATTLVAAKAAKAEAEQARMEAERYADMVRDKIRPALNKAALSMETAIGAATNPVVATAYGFRTGANQENLELASDIQDGSLVLVFGTNQNRVRGEVPAVLRDIGGNWKSAVYVRTTEDKDAGTVTRDSRIKVSNLADRSKFNYGFGMWLNETEKDGVVTYNNVQGWTGVPGQFVANTDGNSILLTKTGGGASNNNKLSAVEGKATYAGPAIGAYVHKTLKKGVLDRASAGVFKADAKFEVKFGGNSIPTSERHDISGTISNFQLSGGEENEWTLKMTADNFLQDNFAYFEYDQGVTSADNVAKKGTFTSVFLEDQKSLAARKDDATVVPGAIQGRFTGYFLNGSVHGAYGVDKQP